MEQKNANPSIACTVASCAYHCKEKNHCTLNEIRVGGCQRRSPAAAPPSARPSSWARATKREYETTRAAEKPSPRRAFLHICPPCAVLCSRDIVLRGGQTP